MAMYVYAVILSEFQCRAVNTTKNLGVYVGMMYSSTSASIVPPLWMLVLQI